MTISGSPIWASGLGAARGVDREVLFLAASRLRGQQLPRRRREGVLPPSTEANMGEYNEGPVKGYSISDHWRAIALEQDAALMEAFAPLVKQHMSEYWVLKSEDEVIQHTREAQGSLHTICLVGRSISWAAQEQLALEVPYVGRIPFTTPEQVEAYAERISDRARDKATMSRCALIVAPAFDGFTIALDNLFTLDLERAFLRHGFRVEVSRGDTPFSTSTSDPASIVVLLTHGEDAPNTGNPVGVGPNTMSRITASCEKGAIIVHLGCNGAGQSRGRRYGTLSRRMNLERLPTVERDNFDGFATLCLARGASAVLAHVDSTWSCAFDNAQALIDWTDWLCSGEGTVGYAADSLHNAANLLGRDAFAYKQSGDKLRSGCAWLRHLDLRGFVLLGNPSVSLQPAPR
jgi:hypothetical protein